MVNEKDIAFFSEKSKKVLAEIGKDMVGQHLKTDVGATGSVKLGLIGGYDLTVGIYPLVFGKDLILHRLVPF